MGDEANNHKSEIEPQSAEPTQAEKVPVVFISYSHDSDEHSKWVLNLANRLMACGVDVDFDQWGLGLGDDIAKYMEKGVSEADRVLMICTEQYVRKADEGKGGVGYEAMIVTGELVRNLGTNKFIPIVRQSAGEPVVPKSVSLRLHVNLSEGQDVEKEFEKLVREIHQTPKIRKPTLGKNPYTSPIARVAEHTGVPAVKIEDAESVYSTALEIARRGDFTAWRKLVKSVKDPLSARLMSWSNKFNGASSMKIKALPGMVQEAATIYSPLMAVALAGVQSGNVKFTNQQAMLDEFLRPSDWNLSSISLVRRVPEALVFTYQALHGATCMVIAELPLAIALSRARVAPEHEYTGVILHRERHFMGWPASLNRDCTMAWAYLTSLVDQWPWLTRIFGSTEEYCEALSAYYMALSIQELALLVKADKSASLAEKDFNFVIPAMWLRIPLEGQHKAYRLLLTSHDQVRHIWRSLGLDDNAIATAWPKWMKQTERWITRVNPSYVPDEGPVYSVLFEDVRPQDT